MIRSFEQWCEKNTDIAKLSKPLQSSKPEQYVCYYLSRIFGNDIEYQKKFSWLGHMSLDIYIPKFKLAIEYNGLHFHRKDREKDDSKKENLCNSNGIKIIWIKERSIILDTDDAENVILYRYNGKKYNDIGLPIAELCKKINNFYNLSIDIDVNPERDNDDILAYVQKKYYQKSIAYKWPESLEYWDYNKNVRTPFDALCSGKNKYILKCPYCLDHYKLLMEHHSSRMSIPPCEHDNCENSKIEQDLQECISEYMKNGTLVSFDDTLKSRRLYDRMASNVKYPALEKNNVEKEMYIKLGFVEE